MVILDKSLLITQKYLLPFISSFGDSGSPLQYKTAFEVFPDDFNKTFLSHYYFSSNVIGIVSFGIDCALNVPSVYTKLAFYRDWMRNVIQNN